MQEVSQGEGRTVLFVSHNMASIRNLCNNGVLLENGRVRYLGKIEDVLNEYLINRDFKNLDNMMSRFENKPLPGAYIENVRFKSANGNTTDSAMAGEPLDIEVTFHNDLRKDAQINIGIYDSLGEKRLHLSTEYVGPAMSLKDKRDGTVVFQCPLPGGEYVLNFTFWVQGERVDWIQNMVTLSVSDGDFYHCGKIPSSKENHILLDYGCEVRSCRVLQISQSVTCAARVVHVPGYVARGRFEWFLNRAYSSPRSILQNVLTVGYVPEFVRVPQGKLSRYMESWNCFLTMR